MIGQHPHECDPLHVVGIGAFLELTRAAELPPPQLVLHHSILLTDGRGIGRISFHPELRGAAIEVADGNDGHLWIEVVWDDGQMADPVVNATVETRVTAGAFLIPVADEFPVDVVVDAATEVALQNPPRGRPPSPVLKPSPVPKKVITLPSDCALPSQVRGPPSARHRRA
jgi:hypothetical protein